MDGVQFRHGRIEDAPAIADVYLGSLRETYAFPLAHTEAEIRNWIREELIPSEEVWIAVAANQDVVAVMALTDAMVDQLYVAPGWSGRGIGTRLLAIAMRRRPAGLDLWTFQVNAGARRFYERHGFVEVERGDGSGNDEGQPDIRYAWRPAGARDLPTIRRSRRRIAERLETDRRAIER